MSRRYSKSGLIILGLIMLCLALGFGLAAFAVFNKVENWFKYVAVVLLAFVGGMTLVYGLIMLIVSAGMNYGFKTHKDSNPVINNTNVNICANCGAQVSKKAHFCHNCGAKIVDDDTYKVCPNCKFSNRPNANYCEKCGTKFEQIEQ